MRREFKEHWARSTSQKHEKRFSPIKKDKDNFTKANPIYGEVDAKETKKIAE